MENSMNNLNFELTVEEANLVIAALAKMPFEAVANLIPKMQQQAQAQLPQQDRVVGPPPSKN
jgi:hypothetical protein